jgi:hypothetical protein
MKKLLTFCTLLIIIAQWNWLKSQSLEITLSDTLVTGYADDLDNMPHSYATIKNNSFNTIDIKAKLTIEQLGEGHLVAFCLGQCYPPTDHDMISPGSFRLESGQSSQHNDFYAVLEHGGNIGTTIIKFRFFDINNENDYAEYRCIFNILYSSVEDEFIAQVTITEAYPNPAKDYLQFNLKNNSTLTLPVLNIYSPDGKVYKRQSIYSNIEKVTLDISDLPAGAYFYNVTENNKKSRSKKFIIAR